MNNEYDDNGNDNNDNNDGDYLDNENNNEGWKMKYREKIIDE